MFSVNTFKQNLSGGGARPTLFRSFITNPIDASGDFKFEFMCKAAQIPPSTLGVIEVPFQGRKIKVAGDRTFPEWTVTITNDEDFLIRNALEKWSNAINGHDSNIRQFGATSNPESMKGDGAVEQLGKNGEIIRQYVFRGLWPSDIAPIDLSFEQNDQIEEFVVTFNYDFWEVYGATGNAGGFATTGGFENVIGDLTAGITNAATNALRGAASTLTR